MLKLVSMCNVQYSIDGTKLPAPLLLQLKIMFDSMNIFLDHSVKLIKISVRFTLVDTQNTENVVSLNVGIEISSKHFAIYMIAVPNHH